MNPKSNFLKNLSLKDLNTKLTPSKSASAPVPGPQKVAGLQPIATSTVTANAGATNPNSTPKYTPFVPDPKLQTKSSLPPAGQQFAQSLAQPNSGLSTIPGPYDPATGKLKDTGATTASNAPIQPPKQESPYLKYLNSMFDPSQIKLAQDNIKGLNEGISREVTRARDKEEELKANKVGMGERGQNYYLGENERLSTRKLADLALAKGASVETLNQIMSAGKEAYGIEQDQLKASEPIEVGGQLFQKQADGSYKSVAGEPKTPSITDQYGTGAIGEYNFAKSQGYDKSFTEYQNEDANRKKSIAAAGISGGSGLSPAQINSTVNSIAGAFDNEPIVKNYNVANEAYQTIKSIGTNTKSPADDIAFIYAFAKIMDPNSVVREGEYNTIQKYAQTWADNFGFSAKRIFSNTNFLTPDAKQKMLNALAPKIDTVSKQYDNLNKEYQRQVNDAYAGKPRQITNYAAGNTPETPQASPSKFDYLAPQITIEGKNALLPRSVWATLSGADKDALLAEAQADGYPLLIKD